MIMASEPTLEKTMIEMTTTEVGYVRMHEVKFTVDGCDSGETMHEELRKLFWWYEIKKSTYHDDFFEQKVHGELVVMGVRK